MKDEIDSLESLRDYCILELKKTGWIERNFQFTAITIIADKGYFSFNCPNRTILVFKEFETKINVPKDKIFSRFRKIEFEEKSYYEKILILSMSTNFSDADIVNIELVKEFVELFNLKIKKDKLDEQLAKEKEEERIEDLKNKEKIIFGTNEGEI